MSLSGESVVDKIRLEHSENFLEELEVIEASVPSCSQQCLFSSSDFLRYLDRIGLESPSQKNFSSEFLAQHPELALRPRPIEAVFQLSEDERSHRAKQIYSDISPGYTRLLHLKPGRWQEPLECVLVPYMLGDPEPYCALSYTWGKPIFPCRIICNDIEYAITQNLSDALRHLRHEHSTRLLWADALCINQADLDEKTFHIPQMYRIYQNAASTVVWLGSANERDKVMLSQIKKIAEASEQSLAGRHRSICVDVFIQMHDWCAKFLQRAWFTRSWIRQEVAASRVCTLMCGESSIAFEVFECGVRKFLNVEAALPRKTASMPVDTTVAAVRFNLLLQQRDDLLCLLQHAYNDAKQEEHDAQQYLPGYICRRWFRLVLQGSLFAATDPRDKVLSMVAALEHASTSDSTKMPDIVPDFSLNYKVPVLTIYQNFVKGLINTSRTLEALSFFRPNYDLPSSGLPTWVSDLRKPEGGPLARGRLSDVGRAELQTLSADFSPLKVRGTILGRIGRNLDYDPRTQDLARVQLEELDPLDLYENAGVERRSLDKLWETGEPMDHILGGMGYGMFEVKIEDHARHTLGLDSDLIVIQATQDAEEDDMIICAYGAFHPLLLRGRAEWMMENLPVQKFCGPTILWKQVPGLSADDSSKNATDKVAASIGFARWRPSPNIMQEKRLGREQDYNLF